jgi:hypothetical protein
MFQSLNGFRAAVGRLAAMSKGVPDLFKLAGIAGFPDLGAWAFLMGASEESGDECLLSFLGSGD